MSTLNAITSGAGGVALSGDTSGNVQIQSAGANSAVFNSFGIGLGNTAPTSGLGITFPATQSASSNANTLDDYEEGTWTPVDTSGASLSFSVNATPRYTKIGNIVNVNFFLSYPGTASTAANFIGGLPFTILADSYISGYVFTSSGQSVTVYSGGGTAFQMRTNTNATPQNVAFSSSFVSVNFTYTVA